MFWVCGRYDDDDFNVAAPEETSIASVYYTFDIDDYGDIVEFSWLNDTDEDSGASGFGNYLVDWAGVEFDGDFVTNWRQTMFVYEDYRAGMPSYWTRP
jgi:hypothetical protein